MDIPTEHLDKLVLELDLDLALQVKTKQAHGRRYRDALHVPNGSDWGVIWTIVPIGSETDASPDGHHTGFSIVGEDTVRVWMIPTAALAGGRGLLLDLFGLVLEDLPERGPLWVFDIADVGAIHFQPWVIRAWEPDSPLVAEILCPPDLPRGRPTIRPEGALLDAWSRETYDVWQPSAGRAMAFLYDVRHHITDGRPRRYTTATEPQFFEDLKNAVHTAVRAGDHVSYASLARHGLASRPHRQNCR